MPVTHCSKVIKSLSNNVQHINKKYENLSKQAKLTRCNLLRIKIQKKKETTNLKKKICMLFYTCTDDRKFEQYWQEKRMMFFFQIMRLYNKHNF